MYIPSAFREERIERISQLMRDHPLATLVTLGNAGLIASHIPLLCEPLPDSYGVLHGHIARANVQSQDLCAEVEALAIFHGPQTYVSPSWYPTRQESGRVVPTWNYAVVHAYGKLELYTDPARLRRHLKSLTEAHEEGSPQPWTPDEAPPEFITGLLNAIVGIDIRITRLEGKWKMNQNRAAQDREGVIKALITKGDPDSTAVANLVRDLEPNG